MNRLGLIYVAVAILYLLLPRDLIPDPIPLLGRLDDLLLMIFLYRRYKRVKIAAEAAGKDGAEGASGAEESHGRQKPGGNGTKSPYEIFGIGPEASLEEIEKRYRELIAQYHPDKVNHLGPELRELAHEKSVEIQTAYSRLKELRG